MKMVSTVQGVTLADMARKRGAQKGYLYQEHGQWKLRWYVDTIDGRGKMRRIRSKPWPLGRCEGPGKLTKREAQRIQAEKMAEVNRQGASTRVTVSEFIDLRLIPDHVSTLTGNGQSHYNDILKHVTATFGDLELPEVKAHHVSQWLQAKAGAGYSQSYLKHMRNVLHKLYEHAYQCGIYEGRNPASKVSIPRSAREPEPTAAYTVEELRVILPNLETPLQEMFLLGATTSMHAAELAGLRVGHLNLTDRPKQIQGKIVPPGSLYACESLAKGNRTSGKSKNRRRVLPIPEALLNRLAEITAGRPDSDPVFYMARSVEVHGHPVAVDTHNVTNRNLKPLSQQLGIKVNWHRLRATTATLTGQMLMDDETRRKMMGHGSIKMTAHYEDPLTKQRHAANAIADSLFGDETETVQ